MWNNCFRVFVGIMLMWEINIGVILSIIGRKEREKLMILVVGWIWGWFFSSEMLYLFKRKMREYFLSLVLFSLV